MTILVQQVTPAQITLGQARGKIAAARRAWRRGRSAQARAHLQEARILIAIAQAEPAR